MVPGYHLEGPFLNAADGYAGCHPPQAMAAPDEALVARLAAGLSRPILLVTVAPELPGGPRFVRAMREAGRIVAVGHSAADFSTVAAAAAAGASLSTHLGNGLPQLLPKLDNTLFAQLGEDRLAASFIADGIHLPPQALKSLIRARVSNAAPRHGRRRGAAAPQALSLPDGVEHAADGSVRVPGGRSLAGPPSRWKGRPQFVPGASRRPSKWLRWRPIRARFLRP
jgi:N-acetylglucosamine-6-phosphate deacetylase